MGKCDLNSASLGGSVLAQGGPATWKYVGRRQRAGPVFDSPPCHPSGRTSPPTERSCGELTAAPAGALVPVLAPCGAPYTGWRLRPPVCVILVPLWEGLLPRFMSPGAGLRCRLVVPRGPSRGTRAFFPAPGDWASPISTSSVSAAVLTARSPAGACAPLLQVGAGVFSISHAHPAR